MFALALVLAVTAGVFTQPKPFSVVEATIPQMQAAMANHQVTSRQLVEQYLQRIGTYEDRINATLAVNPKALEEADQLDRERAQGKLRGPLHGIPGCHGAVRAACLAHARDPVGPLPPAPSG